MFLNFITVLSFVAICLIVFLAGDLFARRKRIGQIGDLRTESGGSISRKPSSPFTQALAGVIPQSEKEVESIVQDLKRAGYYRSTALAEYQSTRNGLVIGTVILSGILAVWADPTTRMPETFLMTGLLVAALGYGLPRFMLTSQAKRRVSRVQTGLPDALDLITMCLRGGLPLADSLKQVSQELKFSHRDVAVEFEIIRRQADSDSMTRALKHFAARIDIPDVTALASIVAQTERMGTHVAQAVCDYADGLRRAYRQRAEEQASKTSIKMLFPVVLCLAPPVYILLCGPPALKLYAFIKGAHQEGGALDPGTLSSPEPITTDFDMEQFRRDRQQRASDWQINATPQQEQRPSADGGPASVQR